MIHWKLILVSTLHFAADALNAVKRNAPDPNTCFRMVGYWGQNSVGLRFPRNQWEKPIDQYCNDNTWDIFIVSFMHIFSHGSPPLPGLNFAYHCENAPFPGYPFLLQCPEIGTGIKKCQEKGKTVLLSMGGAASNGMFTSDQQGKDFADVLWNMFLGGNDRSAIRPFGDDVVFDGVDLDIEGGSPVGYAAFVNRMRELYDTDRNKVYYIGGAPQCPFPDNYLGPTGPNRNYALGDSWFDYIFIQFYNNFCGIQNYGTRDFFNMEVWANWAKTSKTQVFLGVPGADYSGGGYQGADRVVQITQDMISRYGPSSGGWFGGVMTWDVGSAMANTANGNVFAEQISSFLKQNSPNGACSRQTTSSTRTLTISSSSSSSASSSTRTTTSSSSSSTSSSTRTSSSSSSASSSTRTSSSSSRTSATQSPTPPLPGCEYTGPPSSGPGGLWYSLPLSIPPSQEPILGMTSSVHLSPALRLDQDKIKEQIEAVLNWSAYNDASAWSRDTSSTGDYVCSVMSPRRLYEKNPTQMFIAIPRAGSSVTISNTAINVRLLDKWFGMFLAYALDEYGINPHALMSLAAKESFATAVAPGQDNRAFLAKDVSKGYDLYGEHYGYGTDANGDGPFQVEKFSMATTVSIFPGRFQTQSNQQQPAFELDVTIAASPNLDSLHGNWTKNMYRAVVLTSLDLHWRYNSLLMVPGFGVRVPWEKRQSDVKKDELEFAAMFYAYNRGMYGDLKVKSCNCQAEDNPLTECGLDGFGGHGSAIKSVCRLLDSAEDVYDYPISWNEVAAFIDVMKGTFPFSENGANGLYAAIDWEVIRACAKDAFDIIAAKREGSSGYEGNSISFRYDWRLLLAAIRARLPARESLVGPTWYGMVMYSFGKKIATDPGYDFDINDVPLAEWQAEAGNKTSNAPIVTSTLTSMSSTSTRTSSASTSSTRTSTSSTSTSSSASPSPSIPVIPADCTCQAADGFKATRAPGYALKKCDSNQQGVIMNVCSLTGRNKCEWGVPRRFCI